MEYETSYDIGVKPFCHDKNRGKWESSRDFLYVCVGHAFRPDVILALPLFVFQAFGIYAIVPYFVILAVCVVPIVFIQSFLGQFSSTGYISVFRIAPLFKGIGYVSLLVNFLNLIYYSVFSAISLFYFFNSLRPTIPWSCEGASQWMDTNQSTCSGDKAFKEIPSVEFWKKHFSFRSSHHLEYGTYFSVEIIVCAIIVWIVVTFVLLKSTELIGRYIRYSCLAMLAIMSLCLVRFIFLPGATDGLWELLVPKKSREQYLAFYFIPIIVLSTLGPGWGSIITMASYNDFKTDIYKYSWFICLAQFGVIFGITCSSICLKHFMERTKIIEILESLNDWTEMLKLPSALTFLEWPNFWSLLFFSVMVLGCLNLMVTQLFSILTSLFDEFEILRDIKRNVSFGIVAVLAIISMPLCSNHGVSYLGHLSRLSVIMQVILNLLLLLVVLWVYGRERFQRDLNFMTGIIYSTWMVYVVRFVAPIFLLIGLVVGFVLLVLSTILQPLITSSYVIMLIFSVFFFILSFCIIPCYCILKIKKTAGNIGVRLKRCVRPTDWYPADPDLKQSYEERFSSTDISHPLTILAEE